MKNLEYYYLRMSLGLFLFGSFFTVFVTTVQAQAPANDEVCSGFSLTATSLTVNTDRTCTNETAGTVEDATESTQSTSCPGTKNDDVWYVFTATQTSHGIELSTFSDLVMGVYSATGSCGTLSLTEIACSDVDYIEVSGLSIGDDYYVRVYSFFSFSSTATFDICVTSPNAAPSNDDCSGATSLSIDGDATCSFGSSTTAYTDQATSSSTGCIGTADDDVWFSFVATASNHAVEISETRGASDFVQELYSGSCGSLTSLRCSDGEYTTFTGLTVGDTYYLRVYTFASGATNYEFDICVTTPCDVGDTAPDCDVNYSYLSITYDAEPYAGGTSLSFNDDEFADAISPLGFDFCFDGVTYSECIVSSNGYIAFPNCYSTHEGVIAAVGARSQYVINQNAPNSENAPTNAIMGPWADLDPSAGGSIRTETVGTTPNQVFVVKFDNVRFFSGSCSGDVYTGQIKLYEGTNNIEVHIGEKNACSWNDGAAILGLNGWDGQNGVIPAGYNYGSPTNWTVASASPEGHRFEPSCPSCTVSLPVELSYFDGEVQPEGNMLYWQTETEEGFSHFILEKSTDALHYHAVARIEGAGSNSGHFYSYFDADRQHALLYYRLREVDEDGEVAYSRSIALSRSEPLANLRVYPNPSSSSWVQLEVPEGFEMESVQLFNTLGQALRAEQEVLSPQLYRLQTDGLAKGVYLLCIRLMDGTQCTERLMVQ